ncbi:hypothetical protein NDN08_007322 [Rhodosorus marinus]|uniref:Uncharacterized protein n=1 Tax=Rhodosorus marinus TaxID=101924 RepID=A0AAV8UG75_9RHOD|nr:hypothetical protein NDN08_007322 [Rhodosorus marinus]
MMGFVGSFVLGRGVERRVEVCCRRRRSELNVFLPPDGTPKVEKDDGEEKEEKEIDLRELRRRSATTSVETLRLGVDELNELYEPDYTDRLKYVLKPDEQFSTVFTWESLIKNARELELKAWEQVAEEEELTKPTMADVIRAENFLPEMAIQRAFFWTSDWGRIKSLVFRKVEIFGTLFDDFEFELHRGTEEWLTGLRKYNVPKCLCTSLSLERAERVLEEFKLRHYFHELVTIEDEAEDFGQSVLLGCDKLKKPPHKTVAFCDRPEEIVLAHECQMKAVALIGAYKAYDFRSADSSISGYDVLGIYNVRKLFAEETNSPELQPEPEREVST